MEQQYRFVLQPYKGVASRHTCPSCGAKRKFALFIDTSTGEQLPEKYGRCERINNCGYYLSPYQDSYASEDFTGSSWSYKKKPTLNPENNKMGSTGTPPSYIDKKIVEASLNQKYYSRNHFVQGLLKIFGGTKVERAVKEYLIGTAKKWEGAVVFYQIDKEGNFRAGKIMLHDPITCKRVDKKVTWLHSVLKLEGFTLIQCLFGEHLLNKYPKKPVGLVESEKTAIICSMEYPDYVWLATGGFQNLKYENCSKLEGRKVVIFPDANKYHEWKEKARVLKNVADVTVSDLLEKKATRFSKMEDFDLADYILHHKKKKPEPSYSLNQEIQKQKSPDPVEENEQEKKEAISRIVKMNPVLGELINRLELEVTEVLKLKC